MRSVRLPSVCLLAIGLVVLACGDGSGGDDDDDGSGAGAAGGDSSGLATDKLFPGIEVRNQGNVSMRLEVRLSQDGDNHSPFVELEEGDHLEYTIDGETRPLPMESTAAITELGAHEEDLAVSVALIREEHTSAPSSTLSVPPQLSLSSPLSSETYSRAADDIIVTWSPSGLDDDIVLDFHSSCSAPLGGLGGLTVADTGSYTIEAGTLVDADQQGTCELWGDVSRRRAGTLDPAYAGGHIYAEWRETARFTSTP